MDATQNGQETTEKKLSPMGTGGKVAYAATVGFTSLVGLEAVGMGGAGLFLALVAGGTAAYFSEELRGVVSNMRPEATGVSVKIDKEGKQKRHLDMNWLLTGESSVDQQKERLIEEPVVQGKQDQPTGKVAAILPSLPDLPTRIEKKAPIFPLYGDDEILHLGKVIATGQRFDPSINDLLGAGAIFAGSQGSGKTVAVAVVAEHVGERGMSEVIFDMKSEYGSILPIVSNGIIAGHSDAAYKFAGKAFFPLTEDNAHAFAAQIMDRGYQAIIDIPSFLESSGNDWNLVARVITRLLNGLMAWAIARKTAEERMPCLIAFDEAHIFFPQNPEMKNLFDVSVLNALNATAFSMVNMGRSYGYTMMFLTQRIANIAKWTIGNCQIKVVMKHSVDVDLERCSKELGKDAQGKWFATEQDIRALPANKGHGYVLGFTTEPYLIAFDMRRSYHPSNTPRLDRLQKRKEVQPGRTTEYPSGSQEAEIDPAILAMLQNASVSDVVTLLAAAKMGNSQGNPERVTTGEYRAHLGGGNGFSGMDTGTGNGPYEEALTGPAERFPLIPDTAGNPPRLGNEDKAFSPAQEQEFISRFRRNPDILFVLGQMPNTRNNGIGLGKRYYRYAKWVVENKIAEGVTQK